MRRGLYCAFGWLLALAIIVTPLCAQQALTWRQVQERFRKNNPDLIAGQLFVEENRANEVTAGLRPNPQFTSLNDEFDVFQRPFQPFQMPQWTQDLSQLIERRNKRHLRVESAKLATEASGTDLLDEERQLTFALRGAFVQVLQAKSLLDLARANLTYYDKVIELNRERLKAGDIAKVDLTRIELQRSQFESDLVNAQVSLRTAKIQLLALMNERQPVDSFDVNGKFDFEEPALTQEEVRQTALDTRPDLRSAVTLMSKARVDHQLARANGSTDPTIIAEYQRMGPENTIGVGVSIPIRIFDKNQGEKARTEIEIRRSEKARDSILSTIFRDVDSAYATVQSTVDLLRPYRDHYLKEAGEVRDMVSFSYQHGQASLLDFLDAQKSYRDTELAYRNLIGSYLSAVSQLNYSVGKEVM